MGSAVRVTNKPNITGASILMERGLKEEGSYGSWPANRGHGGVGWGKVGYYVGGGGRGGGLIGPGART